MVWSGSGQLLQIMHEKDGTNWTIVNEETSCNRTSWEAMDMEKKSLPVAITVQMEVVETMETLIMDQAQ